ncbi:MAG: hypothetical protein WAK31_19060 [Chthoniobacterales bacterium]
MTTANYYVLAEPRRFERRLKEEGRGVATKQSSLTRPKVEAEPETRLWKICAEAAPPRLSGFERIALLVFGASAFVALACCAFEWFHLFSSGALEHTVRALLTR